ncbi:MAG TPA: DUF503 domain-containing protein [Deltaproteobacteria bacterium]|nr:DUF503 domain-containing protein [Deltaproteobacteria bacterium]
MMVVGISRVDVFLSENHSLKDKRQAVRKIVEKTRSKFSISIAEVERTNLWQRATIGFSVVGSTADHVHKVIDTIHEFIESLYIGKIIDTKTEIVVVGDEV